MYLKSLSISNKIKNKKSLNLLACSTIALFTIWWRESPVLTTFEQRFYDLRTRLLSRYERPSSEIVIVGVDDQSLARLDPAVGRWPWPRAVFAGLVDYCSEAKAIVVDILFSEADSYYTSSDDLFVEEVKKQANVVFAFYLSNQASSSSIPARVEDFALHESFAIHHSLPHYHSALNPYPSLLDVSAGLGHANYVMDSDGVLRSYSLACRLNDKIYPSLALAAAMKYEGSVPMNPKIDENRTLQFSDRSIAVEPNGSFRLVMASEDHKTYSVADILDSWQDELKGKEPRIKREEFDSKIVFIGSLATGLLSDHQVTTGYRKLEGVRIEAIALDNLLNGKFVRTMRDMGQTILIFLLSFIPLAPSLQRPRMMITMVVTSSFLYLLIVTYCLFIHRLMLPISAPLLCLFISSIVLSVGYWYREITHRKSLEVNLKDAYENLRLTNDRLEEYSQTLEVKVDRRTKELKEKNTELESEIAERKRVELTLVEKAKELADANAKLKSISRHKDQFLANMSHELRTPLNVILGAAELLREGIHGPINSKQLKSVRMISDSGQHLLALINDILDLAKIEEGKIELTIRTVSVQSLCEISLQFIKQLAQKKGINVFFDYRDKNVKTLQTDERRLKQILVNLLTNAVKFTPEKGSVGLEVIGAPESKQARFVVWDTGIGIPDDDMDRLFHPFVQLDSSLKRQHEGTGLGLSLVDRLTTMLNGHVSLESKVGSGSRFTVTLPWLPEEQTEGAGQENKPVNMPDFRTSSNRASQSPTPPMILLAEDNEATIETIREFLTFNGLDVTIARNGIAAIALAKDQFPDLILMDIQMPEMDGLQAIRQIRNDAKVNKIPIIALTALAMPDDLEKCITAGADTYISKPVKLQNLLDMINEQLQKT